jgi:hypothetical protein
LSAANAPCDSAFGQLGLPRLEQLSIDDGLMLALVRLPAIDDLADIEAVLEQMSDRADPVSLGGDGLPIGESRGLGLSPSPFNEAASSRIDPRRR